MSSAPAFKEGGLRLLYFVDVSKNWDGLAEKDQEILGEPKYFKKKNEKENIFFFLAINLSSELLRALSTFLALCTTELLSEMSW